VLAKDVGPVFLGIIRGFCFFLGSISNLLSLFVGNNLSLLDVVAWESLFVVGDEEASITGTFHSTKNSVSSGGTGQTNIKESFEWAAVSNVILHGVQLTVNLGLTFIQVL